MRQELAALRLGFLGQDMRHRQKLRYPYRILEIQPCLAHIKSTLYLLSGRLSEFQSKNMIQVMNRIAAHHGGASEQIVDEFFAMILDDKLSFADAIERLPGRLRDHGILTWVQLQEEDWADFQNLLGGIVGCDAALDPWFVTGDHLGDVVRQLKDDDLEVPLSNETWDYLYAGVDRLPEPIRVQVNSHFPWGYRSRVHLILQLEATFNQLCDLLAEDVGRQLPHWDRTSGKLWFGSILVKHFKKPAENQRKVLDAFQADGFRKNDIPNPFQVGHTNLNAAIEACKRTADDLNKGHETPGVIKFGHRGNSNYMTWKAVVE